MIGRCLLLFQLSFDHVNQTQVKSESDITIRNLTAKEDIWGTESEIDISKSLNDKHDISVECMVNTYESRIDYMGSTLNKNNTSQLLVARGVAYTFSPSGKLFSRLGMYATYYRSKTSGVEESKFYPTVNFNINWMPTRGHRLGAFFNYSIDTPNGSQTNAVLLQTDLLKWSQGNPNLRSYHTMTAQLSKSV